MREKETYFVLVSINGVVCQCPADTSAVEWHAALRFSLVN
jgi:hypothetical protein